MCVKCARRTPVGYRCKECVTSQQAVFFNAQPLDPVIQLAVSAVLSAVAAGLVGLIGGALGLFLIFLITIPASTAAGVFIADVAHRAAGRRQGRYGWLAVGAGIILGALAVGALPLLLGFLMLAAAATAGPEAVQGGYSGLLRLGGIASLGWWVYVVAATISAVGRLRMGK
jgi:hypothetical protein